MSRRIMGRKSIFSFIIEIVSFTTLTARITFLFDFNQIISLPHKLLAVILIARILNG